MSRAHSRMLTARRLFRLTGGMVCGMIATGAWADTLPLRHGEYVGGFAGRCTDAPFAAVSRYDGEGFGDPHNSNCSLKILARRGNRYTVVNTCRAEGDGTPLASPGVSREEIVVHSTTSYTTIDRVGKNRYSSLRTFCPGYGR